MIWISILIWKVGGVKEWTIRKCGEKLHPAIVSTIKFISTCPVSIINCGIWSFYMFVISAVTIFVVVFIGTVILKSHEYMVKKEMLPF
jgi:hypothetical protein